MSKQFSIDVTVASKEYVGEQLRLDLAYQSSDHFVEITAQNRLDGIFFSALRNWQVQDTEELIQQGEVVVIQVQIFIYRFASTRYLYGDFRLGR